jgi:hypothetical protein
VYPALVAKPLVDLTAETLSESFSPSPSVVGGCVARARSRAAGTGLRGRPKWVRIARMCSSDT